MNLEFSSEIRHSEVNQLLVKARSHDYGRYLSKIRLMRIRGFFDQEISFDFPVTALIGPNGSGKSAVLGAAGCAYKPIRPGLFFPKSSVGDESMSGWRAEYELIDKKLQPRQTIRRSSNFRQAKWVRGDVVDRDVAFFGIERTVPAGEKSKFKKLAKSSYVHDHPLKPLSKELIDQVEHIIGKNLENYAVTNFGSDDIFLVGSDGKYIFSEFHFGAGESSIIRMVSNIENMPMNSLVLIEEIENGLHPVATKRMVEYFVDVARRKSVQTIFTTHSDDALAPLPSEAIWACLDGNLRQGRLSVKSLRAVSGRIDKKVAVFVEDDFAKHWVEAILREKLLERFDHVEVHSLGGDGTAVSTHLHHQQNPAAELRSVCVVDGDSQQKDDEEKYVYRLPGTQPERSVFDSILDELTSQLAILTVSCQRDPSAQGSVKEAIMKISKTNRDPHLIFSQIGVEIGFVSEEIVRGAFMSIWVRQNDEFCTILANAVDGLIE